MTEWRPIPGYEGYYEVSDTGLVRGLTRKVTSKWGVTTTVAGRILKPGRMKRPPYQNVKLSRENVPANRQVHHLVLETFIGPRPPGMWGLHRDGDLDNNHVSNLYWGTPTQNYADAMNHGTHKNANATLKSHCIRGHEYTDDNTYWHLKRGVRQCRECNRIRQRQDYKAGAIG